MDDSEFALEAVSEGGVDIFGDLGVGDAWREVECLDAIGSNRVSEGQSEI